MTCGLKPRVHSPVRKSRKKCKKSQFRNRKSGYCRKRKCGSGRTRDLVTGLCRNKKSRRARSRKSPKRKSRSVKSVSRKSVSRKSSTRKSRSRKSPCPTGMIRNKSNGKCRVKCVPGKTTRSRSTGRCRKIKSITRKSRSRKSSPRKKLPKCTKEGQTRSRKSRRCRVPPCPPGKIRNKSTGGKCLTKCQSGRIRGPTGRCIKRPKKSEMSSDETGFINSGTRDSDDLNDPVMNWHMTGDMLPNSRGVIPPPSVKSRGFDDIDTPAWSANSMSSADHPSTPKYIKVGGVLQKNPAYTGVSKYKNVDGFLEHNPAYVGGTRVYSNYYTPRTMMSRRRRHHP